MNEAIAAELSGYARAAKMTHRSLAAATGMDKTVIQRYLSGQRDINVTHIVKLAHVLKFEPAELWRRAEERLR